MPVRILWECPCKKGRSHISEIKRPIVLLQDGEIRTGLSIVCPECKTEKEVHLIANVFDKEEKE